MQHNAAITATCVRVCKEFVCPYSSCSDCYIVLCSSWLVVVVVVVVVECCCCIPYRLALMLVQTFAPCALTFASCTCGVILLSTSHLHTWWWSLAATCTGGVFPSAIGVNIPCTSGGATHCNLRWWSFSFHPMAHILHLCSSNLHCVVVVGGICIYLYI